MKTTTLQLLPTTTHGTPSGTYDGSSLSFAGPRQKAADYYGGYGDLQTVAFFLAEFVGSITIEATLDELPAADSNWFAVADYSAATPTTENFSRNIVGNYTWIRATVSNFTAGTISKLALSY